MRKPILALLITMTVSMLVLTGCKGDEPAAEQPQANEPTIKAPAAPKSGSNPQAEKAAIESAQAWFALVDAEKYAEGWDAGSQYLRGAVPREIWRSSLKGMHKPLGKMVSRQLISQQYTTSMPGAPDGQYVILQYQTTFENKKSAIETITPALDKDGKCRVSGYFIK